MKKWFEFCPRKSFFELKILWTTTFLILMSAAIPLTLITLNSDLNWDFSYKGFNEALTIFKVPLGITAILIPAIAILAANHRSVQSKETMQLSQAQNTFANYFKHREEFVKHCSAIEKANDQSKTKISAISIHEKLFPEAKLGNFDANKEIISAYEEIIKTVINRIREHREVAKSEQHDHNSKKSLEQRNQTAICLSINTDKLKKYIQIDESKIDLENDNKKENILNMTPHMILKLNVVYFISRIFDQIVEFDFHYSKELKALTKSLQGHITALDLNSPISQLDQLGGNQLDLT